MPKEVFVPSVDLVDDAYWIETSQSFATTTALWQLLEAARREPQHWIPRVVLCGEPGVGKSALANRFVKATQRNVACLLLARQLPDPAAERARMEDEARRTARAWAEDLASRNGFCPALCSPPGWVPERALAEILEEVRCAHPTTMLEIPVRPDRTPFLATPVWTSPGNRMNDPIRRTSLAFFDRAERLLGLNRTKRRQCLDRISDYLGGTMKLRTVQVFIGPPELADALAECGGTQVISLDPMPCDAAFTKVAELVFGSLEGEELAALHRATAGRMGPLLHVAAMRGLAPPYAVPDAEIRRLPPWPDRGGLT